jgi:hypothetical protein
LGQFQTFTKIRRDIHNFAFIAGVVVTGDKLLQVSLTPVIKPCPGFSSIPDFHDSFHESFLKIMSKARATA